MKREERETWTLPPPLFSWHEQRQSSRRPRSARSPQARISCSRLSLRPPRRAAHSSAHFISPALATPLQSPPSSFSQRRQRGEADTLSRLPRKNPDNTLHFPRLEQFSPPFVRRLRPSPFPVQSGIYFHFSQLIREATTSGK